MKKRILFLLLVIALSVPFAYAHEAEEDFELDHSELYPISQSKAAGYGSLAFGALIVIILLFHKKMNEMAKKIV